MEGVGGGGEETHRSKLELREASNAEPRFLAAPLRPYRASGIDRDPHLRPRPSPLSLEIQS